MTSYKETREVKSFAFFLRDRRFELSLTQEQLAEKLYISTRMVAYYEAGINVPSYCKLQLIANVLQVSVETLLAILAVS